MPPDDDRPLSDDDSRAGPGDEVIEHIPWDRLTVNAPERPPWLPYLLGAVVAVAAAVAILTFRTTPSEPSVITLPPDSVSANALGDPADEQSDRTADTRAAVPPPTTPVSSAEQIVTEADLMAFAPATGERAAAVRAEWFVLDYFSTSDAARVEKVRAALAGQIVVPEPPPGLATYVDWVRALSIESEGDGTHLVTVLYRTLVAADGESYRAGHIQAVTVPVAVGSDGSGTVLDFPAPVELPTGTPPVGSVEWHPAEPPPQVLERVRSQLPDSGEGLRIVGAETDGSRWRVVVEWGDGTSGRWPYSVVVDGSGPSSLPRDQSGK